MDEIKEEWIKLETVYDHKSKEIIDTIVSKCLDESLKDNHPKLEEELIKELECVKNLLNLITVSQLVFFKSVKLYASWYENFQEYLLKIYL